MRTRRVLEALLVAGVLSVASAPANVPPLPIGAFSRVQTGNVLPTGWMPLTFRHIARHTQYSLVRDAEAGVVVRAHADNAASGLIRAIAVDANEHPVLRWRWKAQNLIQKGDLTRKDGDDFPARIYVSFRYSPERLSVRDRAKYAAARVIYGEYPPHAGLNYVWDTKAAPGTIAPNAFSDRVKMIVVESGTGRLRQWIDYERNIVADYRMAFGEDPPPIAGIALMSDADNTGESVVAYFGDITLSPPR